MQASDVSIDVAYTAAQAVLVLRMSTVITARLLRDPDVVLFSIDTLRIQHKLPPHPPSSDASDRHMYNSIVSVVAGSLMVLQSSPHQNDQLSSHTSLNIIPLLLCDVSPSMQNSAVVFDMSSEVSLLLHQPDRRANAIPLPGEDDEIEIDPDEGGWDASASSHHAHHIEVDRAHVAGVESDVGDFRRISLPEKLLSTYRELQLRSSTSSSSVSLASSCRVVQGGLIAARSQTSFSADGLVSGDSRSHSLGYVAVVCTGHHASFSASSDGSHHNHNHNLPISSSCSSSAHSSSSLQLWLYGCLANRWRSTSLDISSESKGDGRVRMLVLGDDVHADSQSDRTSRSETAKEKSGGSGGMGGVKCSEGSAEVPRILSQSASIHSIGPSLTTINGLFW